MARKSVKSLFLSGFDLKLPPEAVERLDLIVMGAAMVAPKQAEGKG